MIKSIVNNQVNGALMELIKASKLKLNPEEWSSFAEKQSGKHKNDFSTYLHSERQFSITGLESEFSFNNWLLSQ